MSVNSKMTAIANQIRTLLGVSGTMGLDAMSSRLQTANNDVSEQTELIELIKETLSSKASGGGIELPTLTNPGFAGDLAKDKQLIDSNGNVVTGTLTEYNPRQHDISCSVSIDDGDLMVDFTADNDYLIRKNTRLYGYLKPTDLPLEYFGNATPGDVAKGKYFTSASGCYIEGTAQIGEGLVVKSGTTTNRVIDTGLSDIEQFFIYKESQTGTGLIHLHYTKSDTSRMYASAWSTQNYGSKTITNGKGGVTVSGGTITISATQATQGALTSNVTYKWIAVGTE